MEWINVDTSLPETNLPCGGNLMSKEVLISDGDEIYIGFLEKVRGNGRLIWSDRNDDIISVVTFWMPLPENPAHVS